MDSETGEVIFRVCKQAERAVMRSEYVADKQKTETLPLGLGGEERREEMGGDSGWDATAIVGDDERSP